MCKPHEPPPNLCGGARAETWRRVNTIGKRASLGKAVDSEHLSAVGNEPWDTVWDRLTDGFRPETVPAGTVFYQQGDPAREVIFLQTGQIRVECSTAAGKAGALPAL